MMSFIEYWYQQENEKAALAKKVCEFLWNKVNQPENPSCYQNLCWILMAAEAAGTNLETMCDILEIPIDEL